MAKKTIKVEEEAPVVTPGFMAKAERLIAEAEAEAEVKTLADQYEQVRGRLEELGYQRVGSITHDRYRRYDRYLRREDGSQVMTYRLYGEDTVTLDHYEVYKEVSTANNFKEYLAAIS